MSTSNVLFASAVGIGLGLGSIGSATQAVGQAFDFDLGCLNPDLPKLSLLWQNSFDGYFDIAKLGNRCEGEPAAGAVEETADIFEPAAGSGNGGSGDGGDSGGGADGNGGGGGAGGGSGGGGGPIY